MNKAEALEAIDSWIKKGWRFSVDGDSEGWTCRAVGAGLAYADCGGKTFEESVEIALSHATAMEDSPEVVLARYESILREQCAKAFGENALQGFKIIENEWEVGPKRIQYIIRANCDPSTMVDQEMEFWRLSSSLPKEILTPLMIKIEWPEEAEKKA